MCIRDSLIYESLSLILFGRNSRYISGIFSESCHSHNRPTHFCCIDVYKRQVYMFIWDWCEYELDLDVRFPAPQTEDTLDCALLEGELASKPVSYTHLDVYKRQPWSPWVWVPTG